MLFSFFFRKHCLTCLFAEFGAVLRASHVNQTLACIYSLVVHCWKWNSVELLCFLQNLHKTVARSSLWLLADWAIFASVQFVYILTQRCPNSHGCSFQPSPRVTWHLRIRASVGMRRSPSCRPQRRIPSCRLQSSTPRQIRQGRFGEDVAGSSTIWSMLESSKWYLSGVQLRFPHVSNHSVFCCSFRCACAGTPYRNSKNLQHMGVSRNSWCPNLDENVKQYLHICYDMILRDIILCERDVGESHVCMHVHSNMYILLTCMAQDRHWRVKVMALAALACRRGWPLSSTSPEEQ